MDVFVVSNLDWERCPVCNVRRGEMHEMNCTFKPEFDQPEPPPYPRTCAELKSRIDAEWPLLLTSDNAVEEFRTQNCADLEDARISVRHRVVRSCGLEIEGVVCDHPAMLFTEEQAVRALWYQYNTLTPAQSFDTGAKGLVFYWRSEPEVSERFGVYNGRMRYGAVYRLRDGSVAPAFAGMP